MTIRVDIPRTLEGPDRVVDHRPIMDRKKDLVDSAADASTPPTGENDGSKAHQERLRVG